MLLPQISSFQKQSVFALMSGFILAYHKKSHQLFFSRFISFGIIDLFYAERTHQCYYDIFMAWDFKNVDPTILRYLYIQSEKISQLFITAYLTIYFKVEWIEMTWFDILRRGNLLFKVEGLILIFKKAMRLFSFGDWM